MRYRIIAVGLVGVLAVSGLTLAGLAKVITNLRRTAAIAFAQRTSDLLLNTLFAALVQEFDETTPDNVEEGKLLHRASVQRRAFEFPARRHAKTRSARTTFPWMPSKTQPLPAR